MKKLLLTIMMLFICMPVFAENIDISSILDKIELKQGIAYDLEEKEVVYLSTCSLLKWKNLGLEAGYASNDKAVAVASYRLGGLKDLGIEMPILDLLEANIGYHVGFGRIDIDDGFGDGNNELSHGPTLTLINLKW